MEKTWDTDLGDKQGRPFFSTCMAHKTGNGHAVTIPKRWGFKDGDLVDVRMEDSTGAYVHDYKRLCRQYTKQNGIVMFIDKSWGMNLDDFVTIRIILIGRNCPAGSGMDARRHQRERNAEDPLFDEGIGDQEGDEGLA